MSIERLIADLCRLAARFQSGGGDAHIELHKNGHEVRLVVTRNDGGREQRNSTEGPDIRAALESMRASMLRGLAARVDKDSALLAELSDPECDT